MDSHIRTRLMAITAIAARYCRILENCRDLQRQELIREIASILPRIYLEFIDLVPDRNDTEESYPDSMSAISYIDEDYYESIRRNLETVIGEEDTFLDTFEEDMKYSDTPIAASISESLADIFQPLYNFISAVKDSDGEQAETAYMECHDNFVQYWSQTLCNVMRPINRILFSF